MVDLTVPSEYGYVLLTCLLSGVQLTYFGAKVTAVRHKAGVPYPYEYADKSEAETDVLKHKFNCYQRVHQNSLENFPLFATMILSGGIRHPRIASVGGLIFLLGRMAYFYGYTSGDPKKRFNGAFGYIGILTMFATSCSAIYSLLSK